MSNFNIYQNDIVYTSDSVYPEDCHDDCKGFCPACRLYLNAFKNQDKTKQEEKDNIPF